MSQHQLMLLGSSVTLHGRKYGMMSCNSYFCLPTLRLGS